MSDSSCLTLSSGSYPPSMAIPTSSPLHSLLHNRKFSLLKSSIEFSTKVAKKDLKPLMDLHVELFPIRYSKNFYEDLIEGRTKVILLKGDIEVEAMVGEEERKEKSVDEEKVPEEKEEDEIEEEVGCIQDETPVRPPAGKDTAKRSESETKELLKSQLLGVLTFDERECSESLLSFSQWVKSFFTSYRMIHIMTFGIIQEFRGLGLASLLFDRFLESVKGLAYIEYISLEVIEYNKEAIEFYKRKGFSRVVYKPEYYVLQGVRYGAKHMSRPV